MRTTAQVAYQCLPQDLKADDPQVRRLRVDRRQPSVAPGAAEGLLRDVHSRARIARPSPALRNLDPDGVLSTRLGGLIVSTYNTYKVKAEDAAKNWQDLLDLEVEEPGLGRPPGFSGYVGIWRGR